MKRLMLLTAFLAATPAIAGGPVIIEDTAEPVPQTRLSPGEKIALAAGLLLIIGLVAGGGGDVCNNGGEEPSPETGC